ncbi:guanine deaminase [Malassezia brasiliensis]|uniref:Guanine deaminase n=1 Tax=Malassezia brasiliensis TaxID=1821822 RepID=A0AAF0DXL8_9BASI|nr:guanine deaminase [Malassezia brasiliensis]
MTRRVFVGGIVTSKGISELQVIEHGILGVDANGIIAFVEDLGKREIDAAAYLQKRGWVQDTEVVQLEDGSFVCPGFIDTHTANTGRGMQLQLLDWLEELTFPEESKFQDVAYAKAMYASAVDRYLRSGTTTACIYATLHLEATKALADICHARGFRAFVGRCQMDRNAPPTCVETNANESCEHTVQLIHHCQALAGDEEAPLVQPILTPRFAISCSSELLAGIGELAKAYPDLLLQTHICENEREIETTRDLFPERSSYADVYDHYGLLNERMILAHAIHLSDAEIHLLLERQCGLSHCPTSNMNLNSGLFRLMDLAKRGIKIGLGSDISGGYAVGMLPVLREASTITRVLAMQDPAQKPATLEALYFFATLGGAQVCGLEKRVGMLAPGYEFDALVVHTRSRANEAPVNPSLFVHEQEPLASLFEKWLFCGDDRNIATVFVRGRLVSGAVPRRA